MAGTAVSRRRRRFRILRLFFGLVASFSLEYMRARLAFRQYDFFEDSEFNRKTAIRLRDSALELGGVLIKVGQFLSSRVDLLPTEYIEELALLQDQVPSVPFEEIAPVLEAQLGASIDSLFAAFDRVPLAAASLGQVHRATLRTGEAVAVKVQRPHIDEIVEADLESLGFIVRFLDRYTPISRRADLPEILKEFEDTLRLELDYRAEGHHAERVAISFIGDPHVAIPRIYWSHSANRVLTMQYMEGTKVTDFRELEAQGISRSRVAEIAMRVYLKQVLEDGFFHADPHPGNIYVRPGPVLVMLDFGMVGEISGQNRDNLRRVFLGVVRRDFDEVLNGVARLGFIAANADRRQLKRALVWTVDTFYEMSFGELRTIDPRDILDQLQDVLYEESFRIPATFAFLGRALGTLSGLCTALDPSFQFVTVAEPYARRLIRSETSLSALWSRGRKETLALAQTLYALPFQASGSLSKVQNGDFDFQEQVNELTGIIVGVERGIRRVLYAVLLSSCLIAGAFILSTHFQVLSIGAFALALILLFLVLAPQRGRRF